MGLGPKMSMILGHVTGMRRGLTVSLRVVILQYVTAEVGCDYVNAN